ncbi:hypothetical protein [Pyxidicoccus trucidator]|uniref:hypothetical protein n=1 Tax=Pyxidicoccus trucidator TaxID=2709662 RepID=UPI0013D97F34|nr:hypothetical protein [Pyxidicoccus trucidator]
MSLADDASAFGEVTGCASLQEVLQFFRTRCDDRSERAAAAAYGMVLVAKSAERGPYREDALAALNQLAKAKAELDIAALHLPPVIDITTGIMLAAQRYADEMTIPCTEWPSVDEIAAVVEREARTFVKASQRPS